MKVCVPTMGQNGLSELVSPHFGRAPTFTIVETTTNAVKVLQNTSEHMGGVGKPPEIMAGADVQVMLCSGLGPRAIQMFQEYGIEVYVDASGTVSQAIEAWKKGLLRMATDRDACQMHRHPL